MMGLLAFIYGAVAFVTFLCRAADACEWIEFRPALGKALLWPLYVGKFVIFGIFEAAKDLGA